MKSDSISTEIIEALIYKAKEGLDVKFLVDGMGSREFKKRDRKRMREAGVQVEVFFPFVFSFVSPRFNYRNHRKMAIIDGEIGYVGGYNIGDEYIDGGKQFNSWRDSAIRIQGSAIDSLQLRFEMDFTFASEDDDVVYLRPEGERATGNSACQIVTSGPDSRWPSIKDGYMKMMQSAKQSLYIETPYFIPDEAIVEALKIASLSGVDVRVLMPGKGDHPGVFWASLSFAGDLLRAGCRFFLYQPGFEHAKVVIADDSVVSVGTANMDIRSFRLNFETNAFIYDSKIASQFSKKFYQDVEHYCEEMTLEKFMNQSLWRKIKMSVFRLFSPLL